MATALSPSVRAGAKKGFIFLCWIIVAFALLFTAVSLCTLIALRPDPWQKLQWFTRNAKGINSDTLDIPFYEGTIKDLQTKLNAKELNTQDQQPSDTDTITQKDEIISKLQEQLNTANLNFIKCQEALGKARGGGSGGDDTKALKRELAAALKALEALRDKGMQPIIVVTRFQADGSMTSAQKTCLLTELQQKRDGKGTLLDNYTPCDILSTVGTPAGRNVQDELRRHFNMGDTVPITSLSSGVIIIFKHR